MYGKTRRLAQAALIAVLLICSASAFGAITMEKIGDPKWEPADVHLFAAELGNNPNYEHYEDTVNSVLKTTHPKTRHSPPYDHEIADGMASAGYQDTDTFTLSQFRQHDAVYLAYSLVPSADAPIGRTRDFMSGPMIANAAFPLAVQVTRAHQGTTYTDIDQWYDIPPYNALPMGDGYSHVVPGFYAGTRWFFQQGQNPYGNLGWWEWRLTLREPNHSGWNVNARFTAVPDSPPIPEPGTLSLLLAGALPALRFLRRR